MRKFQSKEERLLRRRSRMLKEQQEFRQWRRDVLAGKVKEQDVFDEAIDEVFEELFKSNKMNKVSKVIKARRSKDKNLWINWKTNIKSNCKVHYWDLGHQFIFPTMDRNFKIIQKEHCIKTKMFNGLTIYNSCCINCCNNAKEILKSSNECIRELQHLWTFCRKMNLCHWEELMVCQILKYFHSPSPWPYHCPKLFWFCEQLSGLCSH